MKKIALLHIFLSVFVLASAQKIKKTKAEEIARENLKTATEIYKQKAKGEWDQKIIKYDTFAMKFDYKIFGSAAFGTRSLYISLHGGGNTPARVNDQQWENQKKLYTPAEGIYLAPRAPTNTWNLWHEAHVDEMLETIIKDAIVFEGVDPNKIYLLGYSAGGDGLFQLAPRMADHWAAASMMAGHPGDASALPLRNLPFAIFMGGKDAAYDRNKHAVEWSKMLDSLQREDNTGYIHTVHVFDTLGHWMQRKDTIAIAWMAGYTRQPLPSKIVWVQDDRLHNDFYWLGTEKAKTGDKVIVEINKATNEIVLKENSFAKLLVYLNDDMLDLDKPIKIIADGRKIFSGKLKRSKKIIKESVDKRLDANMIFYSGLTIEGAAVKVLK